MVWDRFAAGLLPKGLDQLAAYSKYTSAAMFPALQRLEDAARLFSGTSAALAAHRLTSQQLLTPSLANALSSASAWGLWARNPYLTGMAQSAISAVDINRLAGAFPDRLVSTFSDRLAGALPDQLSAWATLSHRFSELVELPLWGRLHGIETLVDMRRRQRELIGVTCYLARAGWLCFPDEFSGELAERVWERKAKRAELDKWFDEHLALGGKPYRALSRRLVSRRILSTWRGTLRDCLAVVRSGRPRAVIATLFSVLEGVVAQTTDTVRTRVTNPARAWRGSKRPPRGLVVEVMSRATQAFLKKHWERRDFDGTPPKNLNRHWVQHGRHPEMGDRIEALKLLVAIDFVADTSEDMERLADALRKRKARTRKLRHARPARSSRPGRP